MGRGFIPLRRESWAQMVILSMLDAPGLGILLRA